MTDPFHTFATRAEAHGKVRYSGRDQLRMACPVCGGKNTNTLSAKRGDHGGVLLCCFKSGCEVQAIAHALGLELADLFPPRQAQSNGAPPTKRRGLLPPSQALELIDHEAQLVTVAALNTAHGVPLSEADLARLVQAANRITYLMSEVRA